MTGNTISVDKDTRDPVFDMQKVFKDYPDFTKQLNDYIKIHGRQVPSHIFMPDLFWAFILVERRKQQSFPVPIDIEGIQKTQIILGALGTWRFSQGIYKFDNTLLDEILKTKMDGDIPFFIFEHLPEWCIYIETQGVMFKQKALLGFWVYHTELGLCLIFNFEDSYHYELIYSDMKTLKDRNIPLSGCDSEEYEQELGGLLALVLYICSQEPEIKPSRLWAGKPVPKRTKKGLRFFPADKPLIFTVGESIGQKLREQSFHTQGMGKKAKRPHLRRAHWHGYWTGPRDGERSFILKWLPPVFVDSEQYL